MLLYLTLLRFNNLLSNLIDCYAFAGTVLLTTFTIMSTAFIIFCVSVFLVEMFLVYFPLYLVSYKIAGVDKVVDDKYLVWILILISFILSFALFPFSFDLVRTIYSRTGI